MRSVQKIDIPLNGSRKKLFYNFFVKNIKKYFLWSKGEGILLALP